MNAARRSSDREVCGASCRPLIISKRTWYLCLMRVALDAIPLVAAKTGIGHYTDALSTWLARTHPDHQYELVSPFDFTLEVHNGALPANLSKRFTPVRSIFRKWWLVGLPALLRILTCRCLSWHKLLHSSLGPVSDGGDDTRSFALYAVFHARGSQRDARQAPHPDHGTSRDDDHRRESVDGWRDRLR